MAYTQFRLPDLTKKFGIEIKYASLNMGQYHFNPTQRLIDDLEEAKYIPHLSEKARSEHFIVPLLKELRRQNPLHFNYYSGYFLNADKKRKLNGECDFLLTTEYDLLDLKTPIFTVVEAKRNEIEEGIAQAAAQMLGAYIFNANQQNPVETIYGASTNAFDWIFLKLEHGKTVTIDTNRYYLNNIPQLLGVIQWILDTHIATLRA